LLLSVSNPKKADIVTEISKDHPPEFASIFVRGNPELGDKENGILTCNGKLDLEKVEQDFALVPFLNFVGLGQHSTKPIVFKRVDRDIPIPTIWRGPTAEETAEIGGIKDVGGPAVAWYGEEVDSGGGSASLMVDLTGRVFGSVSDGKDSYYINTLVNKTGSTLVEFNAVALEELLDQQDAESADDLSIWRLSSSL
jgi:hypothetical protein